MPCSLGELSAFNFSAILLAEYNMIIY